MTPLERSQSLLDELQVLTDELVHYTGTGQHTSERWESLEMARSAEARVRRIVINLTVMVEREEREPLT